MVPEGDRAVTNAIDRLARLPARRFNRARDDDRGHRKITILSFGIARREALSIAVYKTSIAAC